MKDLLRNFIVLLTLVWLPACESTHDSGAGSGAVQGAASLPAKTADFAWQTEQFADLRILRYRIPGFEELSLKKKEMLYYLYEAALAGRDIIFDQNYKHNLCIRRTLEAILDTYNGERSGPDWDAFMEYTKRVWFSNGIHHHYASKKLVPGFSFEYLRELVDGSARDALPFQEGESMPDFLAKLQPILFDPGVDAKRVNKNAEADLIADSANNYYEGVNQSEVEAFYASRVDSSDPEPISHGLNSKLLKQDDEIFEKTWKVGGMYSGAIKVIVYWLKKASAVAESGKQKAALELLVEYYETGDLRKFDEYNIAWVQDTASSIDVVNGFIEVYGDALGYRASFESVVSMKDLAATKRIAAISNRAQWFEDHAPLMDQHKKANVTGISAKVITVVALGGDCFPSAPIGINLPNANWIRANHGSKSVNLGNIVHAYEEASKGSGALEEFAWSEEQIARARQWNSLAGNLETDMHEVIGHASGRINPGVGTPKETLKSYASTLEEARADLVALYYMMDPELVEMRLMPSLDVGRASYDMFILNGLLWQLRRLEPGEQLEEDHMRNRQLICKWALEKGAPEQVIERKSRDGKTYYVINDYAALRELFGQLLREIQRIKSEGDYESGKELVETYGVKVDPELHTEVLQRAEKLGIAAYAGFINPRLVAVYDATGKIRDVRVEYPDDFATQHREYSRKYSYLPTYN